VASFRATLAEVAEADLLLKVIDASSPQVVEHNHTITNVLRELDVASDSAITILNKIDRVHDDGKMRLLKREFPNGVMISASQRLRLDQVERAILAAQSRAYGDAELSVPDGYEHLISEMYDNLEVKARIYEDGMTRLSVHGPTDIIASFRHRLENGVSRRQETHQRKK
jgi:GTP-binding protein HflX